METPVQTETPFEYDLSEFIPFRDREACERVRRITRGELTSHPNPDFRIAVVDDPRGFYRRFAEDLVGRNRTSRSHVS